MNIIHAWSHLSSPKNIEPFPATMRRRKLAEYSWWSEAVRASHKSIGWIEHGVDGVARIPKRTSMELGDPTPVAFYREVIDTACDRADALADIVILSNADVCFGEGMVDEVIKLVSERGSLYSHRRDFDGFDRLKTPEEIRAGSYYPGSDLWAFSVSWWLDNKQSYPDMLFGREFGDCILRQFIKRLGGAELKDFVYHADHKSDWETPGLKETLPGNIHNRKLAYEWMENYGGHPDDWRMPTEELGFK